MGFADCVVVHHENGFACHIEGDRRYRDGDYAEAARLWREGALVGNRQCALNMAWACEFGIGVEKSADEAEGWRKVGLRASRQEQTLFPDRWTDSPGANSRGRMSVIVPVFGEHRLDGLRDLVEVHLRAQTYRDFEILVACDGPHPRIREYAASRPEIRFLEMPERTNDWGYTPMREALKVSTGEFVQRMNDDNVPFPNFVEEHVKAFSDDVAMTICRVEFAGDALKRHASCFEKASRNVIPQYGSERRFALGNLDCMNYAVRRSAMDGVELVTGRMDSFASDFILVEDILERGGRVRFIDKVLGFKR
jgi:cellulose synthase/poly-beta-1,6-N-acetylglucosamine synthase-like glycosyltransferase